MSNTTKQAEKAAKKRNENSVFGPLVYIAGGVCLVAIIMMIIVGSISSSEAKKESQRQEIINTAQFHEGIVISGIDIGKMTLAQAKDALKSVEEQLKSEVTFTLKHGIDRYVIDAESFDLKFNTEEILNEAILLGRSGGLLALEAELDKFKEGVTYSITYELETTKLSEKIDEIAAEIYVEPIDAVATIVKNTRRNYNSIVENVPFTFEEDVDGLEVDKEALLTELKTRAAERRFGDVEVPDKPVEAKITLDKLKDNVVCRAWFYTSYARGNGANRVHNVNKAADRMFGTVVEPNGIFSTEAVIGRRTIDDGWLPAPAVISGGAATEDQPGGGVCQVSTTLYNALVKADMKIVDRRNHSKASSYVDPGLDATINTDTIDFVWQNNTEYPAYVFAWLDTARERIYCAVYGQKFPDKFDRIEFAATLSKVVEPTEDTYTELGSFKEGEWALKNEAITGYIYDSYRYYYNGKTLVDTVFEAKSTYKMHPRRYYVYKGYEKGTALDPYLEMTLVNGTYRRKYTKPSPTPTVAPTTEPVTQPIMPTTAPTTAPVPTTAPQP